MAQGVILAAGYSSRAQSNKMLLKINDKPLIEHAVDGMRPYVTHIFLVTGHASDTISSRFEHDPMVTCVFNADYAQGMFSSIKKGVFMTHEDFFLLPGDCPFVGENTYQMLLDCKDDMCVPSYQHRRGHPLFVRGKLKDELLSESNESSLKTFRNKMGFTTIDVDDPHVLIDIDTKENFAEVKHMKEES